MGRVEFWQPLVLLQSWSSLTAGIQKVSTSNRDRRPSSVAHMCLTCSYLPLMLPTCNTSHLLARAALIHPTMSSWDHHRGMHTGVNHTVQLFQAQASKFDSARRSRAHRTCTRLTCKVHSVCMAGRTRCR